MRLHTGARELFLCGTPKFFQFRRRKVFERTRRSEFHFAETPAETKVAATQSHFGIGTQMPSQVHDCEKEIAQFGFDGVLARRVLRRGFSFEFRSFFSKFGKEVAPVCPVEPGFGCLRTELGGLGQSGEGAMDRIEAGQGFAGIDLRSLFRGLDFLPVAKDTLG